MDCMRSFVETEIELHEPFYKTNNEQYSGIVNNRVIYGECQLLFIFISTFDSWSSKKKIV